MTALAALLDDVEHELRELADEAAATSIGCAR